MVEIWLRGALSPTPGTNLPLRICFLVHLWHNFRHELRPSTPRGLPPVNAGALVLYGAGAGCKPVGVSPMRFDSAAPHHSSRSSR